MAGSFSWSDTVKIAFNTCLPCLKPTTGDDASLLESQNDHGNFNGAINRIPRARPDELQGLLADPDTDGEAERMSLHSNPGRGTASQRRKRNRRKMKKASSSSSDNGNPRRITLFGYDLFGKRSAPIQLPDDSEDALYVGSSSRRAGSETGVPSLLAPTHSTGSTFDSDAAPLDADAIDALSSPGSTALESAAQAAAEAEEQRLKEKEERRRKRREKKEMKRIAEVLAQQGTGVDEEEFEGFQGSGGGPTATQSAYPRLPNGMFAGSDSGSGSGSGRSSQPQRLTGPHVPSQLHDNDDDEAADLDGGLYTRRGPRGGTNGEGSDSRSRTSASMSDRAHPFHDARNVIGRINSPLNTHFQGLQAPPSPSRSQLEEGKAKKSKSKKSKSSSRTSKSHSSTASTSQSPSLPSPTSPGFPPSAQDIVSPSTVEQGQGFFDLEEEQEDVASPLVDKILQPPKTTITNGVNKGDFPSTRIGGGGGAGGFPSTGFGRPGAGGRRASDLGAFLAQRGDGES